MEKILRHPTLVMTYKLVIANIVKQSVYKRKITFHKLLLSFF